MWENASNVRTPYRLPHVSKNQMGNVDYQRIEKEHITIPMLSFNQVYPNMNATE